MDRIKEIILTKLIVNDDFICIYDGNDLHHGDSSKMDNFYCQIRKQIKQELNVEISEKDLQQVWAKMRSKFVRINLEKAKQMPMNKVKENFYNDLIFLENFISHKDYDVYRTVNKQEIMNATYDRLMGNTCVEGNQNEVQETNDNVVEEIIQNLVEKRNKMRKEDSIEEIYLSDTEELEYLQQDADVIFQLFQSKETVEAEKKIDSPVPLMQNEDEINKDETQIIINAPISLHKQNENKKNKDLVTIRARNEQLQISQNNKLMQEVVNILKLAITDFNDEVIQKLCFDFLINKIEQFMKDHKNVF